MSKKVINMIVWKKQGYTLFHEKSHQIYACRMRSVYRLGCLSKFHQQLMAAVTLTKDYQSSPLQIKNLGEDA